ncbi:MAG: putative metallopeptidase [Actinomycetota bacterium]
MRGVVYEPAPEVAEVATSLIAEFHSDLAQAPVVYVFRTPAMRSQDKTILGRALRVTGIDAFLCVLAAGDAADTLEEATSRDYAFGVVEIARLQWEAATPDEKRALVDHELTHFRIDDDTGELKIRGHDVEEFISIADRHGAWTPTLTDFLEACGTRPGANGLPNSPAESCTSRAIGGLV